MKLSEKARGRFLIIATALFWGLAGVCVKSIEWNALSIMASRSLISIIILVISRRSFKLTLNRRTVLGAVFESATGILYMSSIKLTTAATAIVLQYIAPILVFLFTVIVKKVKPKLYETLIVFAVFGGCALSFADGIDPTRVAGNLLGLMSGFTYAGQIIAFSDKKADASSGILLSNVISFFVSLPFMFFDKNLVFSPKNIIWVLVLGIFQYGLANLCYSKGCQKISDLETSLLLTIEPIFNPFPVLLVTGERPGALAIAGFVIVIAGVAAYGVLSARGSESLKKT